ncbi:MAG TPA: RDD family protein [Pyrinomonadaceae bacterium]
MRSTVPEWRRELSERVREVQERRAREAAQEAAEAERQRATAVTAPAPQLELLPQASAPTMNPLVAAALRRIERANKQMPATTSHARTAAAVAYVTEEELESSPEEQTANPAVTLDFEQPELEPPQPEKTHNLVVVPPPTTTVEKKREPRLIAKRLISDNDPSLNYLDAVPTTFSPQDALDRRAGVTRRVCSALVDLVVCATLLSPFAAAVELSNGDWHKPQTVTFAFVTGTIIAFLYFTMATAFTGRTFGMRMLSLRTIDRRTGLIPTGAQSAKRSVMYIASLFALGTPVIYALLNREGYTAHDRVSHTIVVRD